MKFIIPKYFIKKIPVNNILRNKINNWRNIIIKILKNEDNRIIIITGPCSIHDYKASIEYAYKLKEIANKYKKKIFIIMRVYLEKPRTNIGWKGLINDPDLNNSFNIKKGLFIARNLLLKINNIGLPVGGEILDLNIPNYLIDLYSWGSIGARTCESQPHRELISSLDIPVGIKHTSDGNIYNAINSIISAKSKHHFLSINKKGFININKSKGNKYTHLILRGGIKPNYYKNNIIEYLNLITLKKFFFNSLIVDCSHNNSCKNYKNQKKVINYILKNNLFKNNLIKGIMLESFLVEGNQPIIENKLIYGLSITDSCINFNTTYKIIKKINKHLN